MRTNELLHRRHRPHERICTVRILLLACLALGATQGAAHAVVVGPWQPRFPGIDHATGSASAGSPRLQRVNALRVDLTHPDVRLFSTPPSSGPLETTAATVRQFLLANRLQVAVNANFFSPCCNPFAEPKELTGLAVSEGLLVSQPVDGLGADVLRVTADNDAELTSTTASYDTSGIATAVAGFFVLRGGVVTGVTGDVHPRTTVGLSADHHTLLLLTIDGRQAGVSDGATEREAGEWLQRFGAVDGINLDGGGSTTMVRGDVGGTTATLLNVPVGLGNVSGTERFNGNNLGVWSSSFEPPWCPPRPRTGCTAAGSRASLLSVRSGATPGQDRLRWQWRGAEPGTLVDFGDATLGTEMVACVYGSSGGRADLLAGAFAPAGTSCGSQPCWKKRGTMLRYFDRASTPGAVRELRLGARASAPPQIHFQARGSTLGLSTRGIGLPAIVQLQRRDDPRCWEATYSRATRNDASVLSARSD